MCELLIANEADLDLRDENDISPLSISIDNIEITKLLVNKGADIEITDFEGDTPLIKAVKRQDYEVAEFLLTSNASVNASNDELDTPLHIATCNENFEMCELLIRFGANISSLNINSDSYLHVTCSQHKCSLDTCLLFIKHGIDINLRNDDYETAFNLACKKNNIDVCLELIKCGANSDGDNPLDDVSHYGCDVINLSKDDRESAIITLCEAYKRESKWRNRKDFIIFLTRSKFINVNEKKNNINVEINIDQYQSNNRIVETNTEKVFFLKELDITIASYL